jgi:hypothetical protein
MVETYVDLMQFCVVLVLVLVESWKACNLSLSFVHMYMLLWCLTKKPLLQAQNSLHTMKDPRRRLCLDLPSLNKATAQISLVQRCALWLITESWIWAFSKGIIHHKTSPSLYIYIYKVHLNKFQNVSLCLLSMPCSISISIKIQSLKL